MKKKIFFILYLLCQNNVYSKDMILDQLKNPKLTNQSQEWNFITDQVMGGVSTGKFIVERVDGVMCYKMTGNVSTKNNGGFIQIRAKLIPEISSKDYDGVYIKVYGNEKNYNLHLRTGLTLAPWQYYSYTFPTTKNWSEIRAPFIEFKKSNFYQPKSILGQNIKSIGLVAGFDNFKSDICLSEIGFY
ncbi:CIA30 family protein [Candidatus Pelagibacter sp.]|nr:CIA30 family protein [Candidatus Pelagibacter sp.]